MLQGKPDGKMGERGGHNAAGLMLIALTGGFALSQAYRTVAAIMAPQLQAEFHLDPQALGIFAGIFHFAFGALQLLMGIGIDLYGVRRTVLLAFPLTIAGSLLSFFSVRFGWLLTGQALIGIGCAPAFLVCTVFIAQRFPATRYASLSGIVLGVGGVGMLATGTPLAWLIEAFSWRAGFLALAILSTIAWLTIAWFVREADTPAGSEARASAPDGETPAPLSGQPSASLAGDTTERSLGAALRGFASLLAMRHTWGILGLATVSYAAFVSLRGLWLGPLLVDHYGFSLVASGNVAIAVSVASMLGPALFGRADPGHARRRRWIFGCTALSALSFALLAPALNPGFDIAVSIVYAVLSGYGVLQYADVRDAYPASMTGRALSLFTMALFLGVALMQWLTGVAASMAAARGLPPFAFAFATIALMLAAGAVLFALLPQPPAPERRHAA